MIMQIAHLFLVIDNDTTE